MNKSVFVAALMVVSGCATHADLARDVRGQTATAVNDVVVEKQAAPVVRVEEGLHISATPVDYIPPAKGMVSLRAPGLPLAALVGGLAEGAGLSIAYQAGVDTSRPVTVDLRDVDPREALREVAYTAGYVAVFDRPRSVMIAKEATQTFRVPARLLQSIQARFSVSNSNNNSSGASPGGSRPGAAGQSNTGSSGAGGSGSGSGGSNAASTGSSKVEVSGGVNQDSKALQEHLSALSSATINILAEEGLVTARGTGAQLRRVQSWLDHYVRDGMIQVEVELSVVEVSLSSAFKTGIDWTKIIPQNSTFGAGTIGRINLTTGADFPADAFSIRSTGASVDSIVRALETYTTVHELTRPRLTAMNHARTIYRGTIQRPYLPSAESSTTPSGNSTLVQTTATVGYFEEGVTFQMQPHVLDAQRVELTLIPIVSGAGQLEKFPLSRELTLTAPVQPRQDALLQVLAEHGKTVIIGGMRQSAGRNNHTGVPGAVRVPGLNYVTGSADDRNSAREVVMLLHARIIPSPPIQILVGEGV